MQRKALAMTIAWGLAGGVGWRGRAFWGGGRYRRRSLGPTVRCLEVLGWVTQISALKADQGAMGAGLGGPGARSGLMHPNGPG